MFVKERFEYLRIAFDGEDDTLGFDPIASFSVDGEYVPLFRQPEADRKRSVFGNFDRFATYANLNTWIGFAMNDEINIDAKVEISSGSTALLRGAIT